MPLLLSAIPVQAASGVISGELVVIEGAEYQVEYSSHPLVTSWSDDLTFIAE